MNHTDLEVFRYLGFLFRIFQIRNQCGNFRIISLGNVDQSASSSLFVINYSGYKILCRKKIIFRFVLQAVCTLKLLQKSQGKIRTESVTRPVILACHDFAANVYV